MFKVEVSSSSVKIHWSTNYYSTICVCVCVCVWLFFH